VNFKFLAQLRGLNEKQLLIAASILTLVVAYFSVGFHHFDEHFQIIEFMNYKLGHTQAKNLPWEFHRKMRPWFQPYLYLVLDTPLRVLDFNPFTRVFFLRLYSGLFSLFSIYYLFHQVFRRWFVDHPSHLKRVLPVLLFTWYIPYVSVRPSAESLSISFFFIAIAMCLKRGPMFFFGGVLFGLSYLCRFQMALPIAVFWFWGIFIGKWSFKHLARYAISIIFTLLIGLAIDSYGYSELSFTLFNYFKANFLDGVLKQMGESPWYKYIEWAAIKLVPPISFFLIVGVLGFWKKELKSEKSWLTWITMSFILFHSFIGHKEYRFIYLCASLAPIMAITFFKGNISRYLIALNTILILITLKPANKMIPLYEFLYKSEIKSIYYVDEDPLTLVGLPLKFYFRKGFRSIPLDNKSIIDKYIFTKRFESTKTYLEKGCTNLYINYPPFIFGSYSAKIRKILQKQKVMGVFKC